MQAEVRVVEEWLRKINGSDTESDEDDAPIKPKPKPEPKGFNVDDIPPAVPLPIANSNIAVRAKQLGTEEWIEFASQREAAEFTGLDPSSVSKSLRKNVSSQGWIFERVDHRVGPGSPVANVERVRVPPPLGVLERFHGGRAAVGVEPAM